MTSDTVHAQWRACVWWSGSCQWEGAPPASLRRISEEPTNMPPVGELTFHWLSCQEQQRGNYKQGPVRKRNAETGSERRGHLLLPWGWIKQVKLMQFTKQNEQDCGPEGACRSMQGRSSFTRSWNFQKKRDWWTFVWNYPIGKNSIYLKQILFWVFEYPKTKLFF